MSAQNSKELFFRINMESFLMSAAKAYVRGEKLPAKYSGGFPRKLYTDRFRSFIYDTRTKQLKYKDAVIPTPDEAHKYLHKVHRAADGHVKDIKILVASLREGNFYLPDFVGGLHLLAKE